MVAARIHPTPMTETDEWMWSSPRFQHRANGSNGYRYKLRLRRISMTTLSCLRFSRSLWLARLLLPSSLSPTQPSSHLAGMAIGDPDAYLMAARVLRSITVACWSSLFSRSISRSFDAWLCSVSSSLTIRFCSRSSVDSLALYSSSEPSFTCNEPQKQKQNKNKQKVIITSTSSSRNWPWKPPGPPGIATNQRIASDKSSNNDTELCNRPPPPPAAINR